MDLADFAKQVADLVSLARPAIVAINGRSSSGKTSLSRRLATALPNCAVLHTDDLAWHHGVFSWDELLINDVLPVLRERRPLHYRPPAWVARGRDDAITIDGDRDFVIIEGVGASQASIRPRLEVIIWVDTPQSVRESRDATRVSAGEISAHSYANWMVEENAYMAADRPWEHADLIVGGSDSLDHDQQTEIAFRVPPSGWLARQHPTQRGIFALYMACMPCVGYWRCTWRACHAQRESCG